MTKPNLLVLGSTLPRVRGDGTPGFVLDLALEEQKSFNVTILSPFVEGAKRHEVIDGIKIIRFRYWPFRHTLADGAILDNLKAKKSNFLQAPFLMLGQAIAIARLKPDLIHAHWIIPQGLIAKFAAPKAKLLITTHGGDIYALNNPILRKLKQSVLQKAAAITTVNSQMKQKLVSWGIKEQKISVLPMGVEIIALGDQARKPNSLVVVGRLVEKKGIEFLISAIKQGLKENSLPKDITLKIAGDGPLRAELDEKAKGLPIEFLGNQSAAEVREHFATSQIALLPSVVAASGDQEGLPVTLLEAGANGAFVIASDLPGINEVVIDSQTGLLVPQADSSAILAALQKAFAEPELVIRCSKNLAEAVKEFDHEVIGKKYRAILESL